MRSANKVHFRAPLSMRRKLSAPGQKKLARIDSWFVTNGLHCIGIFRRRSTRKYRMSLIKLEVEPRATGGMIRAEQLQLELCNGSLSCSLKNTGERCSCDTMTRSVPLMTQRVLVGHERYFAHVKPLAGHLHFDCDVDDLRS
jgi:hypothetical protein